MQPIPVPVKNVNIYPYIDWPPHAGIGPVIPPVIEGATGTYAVGTLTTNIFYNLNLKGGKRTGELSVHHQYVAIGQYENGSSFTTPWMFCLNDGKEPTFGRTIQMLHTTGAPQSAGISMPPYITLGPLTDITASITLPPPAIGTIMLIENGKGNIIATRVGTPHEMGVEVTSGDRLSQLSAGLHNIMITGKNKDGHYITMGHLTCVNPGQPAVFIQQFGG